MGRPGRIGRFFDFMQLRYQGDRPAYADRLPDIVHRREMLQQSIQWIATDDAPGTELSNCAAALGP
jgi:hypothetical protein